MIRALVLILSCACVAIVLSEAGAALLMWKAGLLTPHHLQEIRLVFSTAAAKEQEAEELPARPQPSLQEVTQARAVKILDLEKRESELNVLKGMAGSKKSDLNLEQETFRAQRKAFEEELTRLQEAGMSAATEQARGVLLALPAKDAVEKLMQLPLDENVVLLKGMADKALAKILEEFNGTPEQLERGRKIFEALSRGSPAKEFFDEASRQFNANAKDQPERNL